MQQNKDFRFAPVRSEKLEQVCFFARLVLILRRLFEEAIIVNIFKKILRWIGYALIFFFVSSITAVVVLKWMPVYYTPLMVMKSTGNLFTGKNTAINHEWVPLDSITHNMPQAVIASEDNLFEQHHGFDFEQIYLARLEALRGGRERGASTISQQTAKNVFLWPGHSWVRKGLEAYFTFLIEHIWGKKRIMEVYLNSIEMGDGIYGVQAAAHINFGKDASRLTKNECALIASSLPNPIKFDSAHPTGYMIKRRKKIVDLMGKVKQCPWGKK